MTTPVRIGAFVAALAVVFGAAFGIGRLFEDDRPSGRYALAAELLRGPRGTAIDLVVTDPAGTPVGRFATRHEKQIHLIAVRKDFGGYQHLHPVLEASGRRWVVPDVTLSGGDWRLFADVQPVGGNPVVLHQDVQVVEPAGPAPAPLAESLRQSVDGYDVDLAWAGSGAERQAIFTVSRGGVPVTDLEPYLGAYGHLVALSGPDLEFQHVHPENGPAGPAITFRTGLDAGTYRMYLEFQHRGAVHTVPFATTVVDGRDHEDGGMDHGDH